MATSGGKSRVSVSALLQKNNHYKHQLEQAKKQIKSLRETFKEVESYKDKNACLVKENATLRQSTATQVETIMNLQQENVSLQEAYSNIVGKYEDVVRRFADFEREKQSARTSSGVLSNLNIDNVTQKVWQALKKYDNDFYEVFSNELKSALNSSSRLSSSRLLSPPVRSTPDRFCDAPDSLKRFVRAAGPPREASTPLRPQPTATTPIQVQPNIEMPPKPIPAVSIKPGQNARPPKQVNPPTIPAISEEDENEMMTESVQIHDNSEGRSGAPLPPLQPIPSRSAPVRGSKVKRVEKKSRSRARLKSDNSLRPDNVSALNHSESIRLTSKVQHGRLETRVANAIFQEADEEKNSRSRKRKQPAYEAVTRKAEPNIFDFSLTEQAPTEEAANVGGLLSTRSPVIKHVQDNANQDKKSRATSRKMHLQSPAKAGKNSCQQISPQKQPNDSEDIEMVPKEEEPVVAESNKAVVSENISDEAIQNARGQPIRKPGSYKDEGADVVVSKAPRTKKRVQLEQANGFGDVELLSKGEEPGVAESDEVVASENPPDEAVQIVRTQRRKNVLSSKYQSADDVVSKPPRTKPRNEHDQLKDFEDVEMAPEEKVVVARPRQAGASENPSDEASQNVRTRSRSKASFSKDESVDTVQSKRPRTKKRVELEQHNDFGDVEMLPEEEEPVVAGSNQAEASEHLSGEAIQNARTQPREKPESSKTESGDVSKPRTKKRAELGENPMDSVLPIAAAQADAFPLNSPIILSRAASRYKANTKLKKEGKAPSRSTQKTPSDQLELVKQSRTDEAQVAERILPVANFGMCAEEGKNYELDSSSASSVSQRSSVSSASARLQKKEVKARSKKQLSSLEDVTSRSRPRRVAAPTSYVELPLNTKMRRRWDEETQQFVMYHRS